jgi:hypothetical protein
METNILITGLLFVLFFMSLVVMFFFIVEWGKKQKAKDDKLEAEYMKLYNEIQKEIDERKKQITVDIMLNHHRAVIRHKLKRLSELKYKNKEKTSALWINFLREFYVLEELNVNITCDTSNFKDKINEAKDNINEFDLGRIDYERAEKRVTAINNFRK